MLLSSLSAILVALPVATAQVNATNPLIVQTNVGTYQGFYSSPTVRNWLGIRYGRPTNGTRRFKPPQRAAILNSTNVFNASSYSISCVALRSTAGAAYGEDCLSLNIWSPSLNRTNSSSTGSTVMIWIYGGGYYGGSTNNSLYDANTFVQIQSDLLVVTVNYRLSIYGFPAGSGLNPYELNPGLQDQRMAIEWVYNNIRSFGGDPNKITLFGESAGASSIGSYAYTYANDPIARGFIMESGSEFLNSAITVAPNNPGSILAWNSVAASVGCNSSTSASTISCMQQVNITTLSIAVNNYTGSAGNFLPTQDGVHMLNISSYFSASASQQYASVPVLIGTNNNEGTSLVGTYAAGNTALANIITINSFTCPAAEVAESRQNASIPVWQYRYFGTWPNISPPSKNYYAYHGSEIGLVFGNYNTSTSISSSGDVSSAEINTSTVMQAAWVAFAKDPVNGLTNYGWPQYQSSGTSMIQIAFDYYNQSSAVLDAAALPIITFNNSQA